MEITSYLLGIFGVIGLAIFGALYSSHKSLAIWIFFASVVALLLGGCVYWQRLLWQRAGETEYHGVLVPDSRPMPSNPCEGLAPPNAFFIFLGNSAGYTTKFPQTVIRIGQDNVLTMDRQADQIVINARIFSKDGRVIAEIRDNEFFINQNNYFRKERPDPHSLIVYDQTDRKVLDVEYLNSRAIRFLGIFGHPVGEVIVSSARGIFSNSICTGEAGRAQYSF